MQNSAPGLFQLMEITSVIEAVRQIWSFVWAPIVDLVALVAIFRLIAPVSFSKVFSLFRRQHEAQQRAVAYVRLYGARKFIGLIFVFVLLFMLYVSQQLLHGIGSMMPGSFVTYTSEKLNSVEGFDLPCLLAEFPDSDVSELENLIQEKRREISNRDHSAPEHSYGEEQSASTVQAFTIVKAFIFLSVIFFLIEALIAKPSFRLLARFGVTLGTLLLIVGYLSIGWVKAQQ